MGTTAMEARGNVCLLVLVNSNENPYERCRPGECSVWSWEECCNGSGNRLGHCILVGEIGLAARNNIRTGEGSGGRRGSY